MMVGRVRRPAVPAKAGRQTARPCSNCATSPAASAVRDVSLRLRPGEILGIAGLVGSGRTELALTIFGITPATAGEILIDGKPVAIASPEQARDLGIAYIPEDRGHAGPDPSTDDRREHRARACSSASRAGFIVDRLRRDEARAAMPSPLRHSRPRARAGRAPVVGRQSAEGRARQMAGDRAAHPHHGRADARHRCRRQGGNPSADAQAGGRGHGDPDDLERIAGSPRHERPRAGDERRSHRRRIRARRGDARSGRRRHGARPHARRRPHDELAGSRADGRPLSAVRVSSRPTARRSWFSWRSSCCSSVVGARQSALPVEHQPDQHLRRQCLYRGGGDRHVDGDHLRPYRCLGRLADRRPRHHRRHAWRSAAIRSGSPGSFPSSSASPSIPARACSSPICAFHRSS